MVTAWRRTRRRDRGNFYTPSPKVLHAGHTYSVASAAVFRESTHRNRPGSPGLGDLIMYRLHSPLWLRRIRVAWHWPCVDAPLIAHSKGGLDEASTGSRSGGASDGSVRHDCDECPDEDRSGPTQDGPEVRPDEPEGGRQDQ